MQKFKKIRLSSIKNETQPFKLSKRGVSWKVVTNNKRFVEKGHVLINSTNSNVTKEIPGRTYVFIEKITQNEEPDIIGLN